MRKIVNSTHGATAVEFGLVLPFLLVLLFGIIEFAAVVYNQIVITNASREGARYTTTFYVNPANAAKQRPTCGDIQNYVAAYVNARLVSFTTSSPFGASNILCCPNKRPTEGCSSEADAYYNYNEDDPLIGYVDTIRIEYQYGFLVFGNLIGFLAPSGSWSSITLTAQSAMRDEWQGET